MALRGTQDWHRFTREKSREVDVANLSQTVLQLVYSSQKTHKINKKLKWTSCDKIREIEYFG